MSKTNTVLATPTFNLLAQDVQQVSSLVMCKDITKISTGEGIEGTLSTFNIILIKGKQVLKWTVKTSNGNFSCLMDGNIQEGLCLKGTEVVLIFRGISEVKGVKYPKFSTTF